MLSRILVLVIILISSARFQAQDLEGIRSKKPFEIGGGISAFADGYFVKGIEPRSTPFNWRITGSPTLTIYGITLPFYFNIGSQARNFTQPFNQFGVSPKYKWATVHLGWRNLTYSQYTLSGISFFGAGIELNPGKFRFSAMYGRFNRAVRLDTIPQQFVSPEPVYERKGFSAKIGFGNSKNFLDFIFFKAKDDSSTYENAPYQIKPAENAIFGITSRLLLFKHLQFSIDGALSGYTRDLRLDSISDETMKRYDFILKTNASSQLLFAGNASLGYVSKYFGLKLQYKRVDQDYKSMGSFQYQTDIESITIEPSINILKSKIRLSGSIGRQTDNLSRSKMIATSRTIGSVNVSLNPNRKYGLDVQYGNYGVTQRAGIIPINDSIRMAISNQNINIINRFTSINKTRAFTIVLLNTYQEMTNLNPLFPAFIENRVIIGNLNLNYTIIKSGISLSGGYNYSRSNFSQGNVELSGPMLGIGKNMLKNRLNTSLSGGFQSSRFNGIANGITINTGLNLNYRISKSNNFTLNFRLIKNTSNNPVSIPFTEGFISAGYQYTLGK